MKPDGFGYLFEAALNLFGVRSGRADGMSCFSLESAIFLDDLCSVNEYGGIFRLLYNYSFLFLMKKYGLNFWEI